MKKVYYSSNAASIAAAIKGLNATFNVAEFYDSNTVIELTRNGKVKIHLDIQGIINANCRNAFAVVDCDRRDSYVDTFVDYWEAVDCLDEGNYRIIFANGQYDVYL